MAGLRRFSICLLVTLIASHPAHPESDQPVEPEQRIKTEHPFRCDSVLANHCFELFYQYLLSSSHTKAAKTPAIQPAVPGGEESPDCASGISHRGDQCRPRDQN
jgi:hypothetical protein